MKATDIRIEAVRIAFETFGYRSPFKFGGRVSMGVTLLKVECEVATAGGRSGKGFGCMTLGNTWAFPSAQLSSDSTLAIMKTLAERFAAACGRFREFGHPIDLGVALEAQFQAEANELAREQSLAEPIPKMALLVTGSPFDAAIHDAFGKVHGLNCYHTYGRDFLSRDLGDYLGADYAGLWLEDFISTQPADRLPVYHMVGALDPLTDGEIKQPIGDGLPETLPQWIDFNGLTHFKIKLNGDDLAWDIERVVAIDRVVNACAGRPGAKNGPIRYSLDCNERCTDVQYLIAMLSKLREITPVGFDRVQYVEQPTSRDLLARPENRMHEAAKLRPVVIDESLTDLDSLLLAGEMGYTGAALKACKGHSQSLLLAAAAQTMKLFLCVQDLTCPGAALIQSAGLAAHVPGIAGIEANSRQYAPEANRGWDDRYPEIFLPRDGTIGTWRLNGRGLSAG